MTELDLLLEEQRTNDASYAITNVRAVLPDRVTDQATVVVENGRIIEIDEQRRRRPDAIDGANLLLLPGFIDTHSDGLEKEANPRRTARFPFDYAIAAFEGRLRSSGVTTVFHGLGYQEKERAGRTVELARELNRTIGDRRESGRAMVDHRVLFRFEARDDTALRPLLDDLHDGRLGDVPLISFEDHTPGQGQYNDIQVFKDAIDPTQLPEGVCADDYVAQLVAEGEQLLQSRLDNINALSPLALAGDIILLAHDAEDAVDIAAASTWGASVAEFPLSIEAAMAARERAMLVVMGAPNALRGSSHSGNVSARELVAAGLCDVLASDYLPPAMLASAFMVARKGVCSLPQAVSLITSGPAQLAGLADRGSLVAGMRADLTLVDDTDTWPVVVGVRRADEDHEHRIFG